MVVHLSLQQRVIVLLSLLTDERLSQLSVNRQYGSYQLGELPRGPLIVAILASLLLGALSLHQTLNTVIPYPAPSAPSKTLSIDMTGMHTEEPDPATESSHTLALSPDPGSVPQESLPAVEESTCRICWCGELGDDDPLLQPCRCSGSVRYVHKKCNQQWMASSKRAYCEVRCRPCSECGRVPQAIH